MTLSTISELDELRLRPVVAFSDEEEDDFSSDDDDIDDDDENEDEDFDGFEIEEGEGGDEVSDE